MSLLYFGVKIRRKFDSRQLKRQDLRRDTKLERYLEPEYHGALN